MAGGGHPGDMMGSESAPWRIPEPVDIRAETMSDGAVILLRRHGNRECPRLVITHGNGLAVDLCFPFLREEEDGYRLRYPREYEARIVEYAGVFSVMVEFDALASPTKVLGADPTLPFSYLPTLDLSDILTVDYDFPAGRHPLPPTGGTRGKRLGCPAVRRPHPDDLTARGYGI